MNDEELLRYSRQIMLPDFDIQGQQALGEARALILGLGGLGSPAALYLAAAGMGELVLVDHDTVDLSNLQRQIAHTTQTVGTPKAVSAATQIAGINPNVRVSTHTESLQENNAERLLHGVNVVLDCTDNYTSRYLVNDWCWQHQIPVVSGAAIRWEGQVSVFHPRVENSPCYRCLYPVDTGENLNCADNGVMAPLVGMVGATQAMEAIKVITDVGEPLIGKLLHIDAKYMEFRQLSLKRREDCPTCAAA